MLVDAVPARAAPATASGFDILVDYLRLGCGRCSCSRSSSRWRGTWPAGPTPRCGSGAGPPGSCTGSGAAPRPAGPVATWVTAHVRGLRIGAVALAVLVFVFLKEPTGVRHPDPGRAPPAALGVIEFLARPPEEQVTPAPMDGAPAGAPGVDAEARPLTPAPREPSSRESEPEPAPPPS